MPSARSITKQFWQTIQSQEAKHLPTWKIPPKERFRFLMERPTEAAKILLVYILSFCLQLLTDLLCNSICRRMEMSTNLEWSESPTPYLVYLVWLSTWNGQNPQLTDFFNPSLFRQSGRTSTQGRQNPHF